MKFQVVRTVGAVILFGSFCASASAEVVLKDKSEIVGKWLLESVAPGLTKPKIPENRTWEFRADGIVVTSGFNRHFKGEDTKQFSYHIEDGKIRADDPGRPGKSLDYAVYEKSADGMILKGGLEGFYFFKKQ